MPTLFPFLRKKAKPLAKNKLPHVRHVPGKRSQKLVETLRRFECPQITYVGDPYPVFMKRGEGANLWDVDGNRYLDLTSCFGVMGVGHSSKPVVEAIRRQSREMIHGLGDVHPNDVKVRLAEKLSQITPGNLSQTIFSSTGAEAVETAMKTAVMATGKSGILAFTGGYHGLGYGALHLTHRADFRKPFLKQMGKHAVHAPFPDARVFGSRAADESMKAVENAVKKARRSPYAIGAVIIEPIQARGGVVVAPSDFLRRLRELCDREKIILIFDEVFTGLGRTGTMFACEKSAVVPDLLCVGKGLGGGMPISACVGTARVMHAWGASTGDAIHTSTYLGHPLACAAALAVIREIEEKKLVDRSRNLGEIFRRELHKLKQVHAVLGDVRGSGLLIGLEFVDATVPARAPKKKPAWPAPAPDKMRRFVAECLRHGVVVLGSGPDHNVAEFTPPFVISEREILYCTALFEKILKKMV